ncbi:MAG: polysaccharide deacetylase family protein [Solirubrobacterales bacterium]
MQFKLAPVAVAVLAASVAMAVVPRLAAGRPHRDPRDAAGRLDLRKVNVTQVRRSMRVAVGTSGGFRLSALDRHPNTANSNKRFLCLQIHRYGRNRVRQLCFGKARDGGDDTLGYAILGRDGSLRSWKGISGRVDRPSKRSVVARFNPRRAELDPGKYRWHFVSQSTGATCEGAELTNPCFDRVPNRGEAGFRLHDVQPVSCRDSGPTPRSSGPTSQKRIALTFDDGPSSYTPQVLGVLQHHHAKGTFFEIGAQVSSESRAVLKAGQELANHSYHHENLPSRSSLAATNTRIRSTTGFKPCLFRPPGGAYNARLVSDAKALGMTTVLWNVDPRDWSRPGSSAIYSRVLSAARPGAIVIMHDGGGDRRQTVAALPRIIKTLRGRGYHLVTVSKLLGQRTIWGEVRKPLEPRIPWGFLNSPAGSAPATEKQE